MRLGKGRGGEESPQGHMKALHRSVLWFWVYLAEGTFGGGRCALQGSCHTAAARNLRSDPRWAVVSVLEIATPLQNPSFAVARLSQQPSEASQKLLSAADGDKATPRSKAVGYSCA